MTLWDRKGTEGGIDTIDASEFDDTQNLYIDLRAGNFSAIGTLGMVEAKPPTVGVDYNNDGTLDGDTTYNLGIAMLAEIENAKGGNGNDYLKGNDLANLLEGNGGVDELFGGLGNDTLLGGIGSDIYNINVGEGLDIISDSDGLGKILLSQYEIKGKTNVTDPTKWIQLGENNWVDFQNNINYVRTLVNGNNQLLVHKGDVNIVIKSWTVDQLGIAVGEGAIATSPITSRDIIGDLKAKDFDLTTEGIQTQRDDLNNVIVTSELQPNAWDVLYGSAGNDNIKGHGGDDELYSSGGSDLIQGGAGLDFIAGGTGNSIIEGNGDSDIVFGGTGDETIFGGDKIALSVAINQGAMQTSSIEKGDWLDGVAGDDILIGTASADMLLGGENDDILVGGGGDDTMYGERGTLSITKNWTVTRQVLVNNNRTEYTVTSNAVELPSGISGNDNMLGSAGSDWMFGGSGDDMLDGGIDDDVLFGDDGFDLLIGGDGNDVLIGGKGNDYLDGGNGNDKLYGEGYDSENVPSNDYLFGGSGNDELAGFAGDDHLDGGAGIDTLNGGSGNDVLIGSGEDTLQGGADNDTYFIEAGDKIADIEGKSLIILKSATGLSTTISPTVSSTTDATLNLTLNNGTILNLQAALYGMDAGLQFSGGQYINLESWVSINLKNAVSLNLNNVSTGSGFIPNYAYGGAGGDQIVGGSADDKIRGYAGNDTLLGGIGKDDIKGGDGNDFVQGDAGNDLLDGGEGDDSLLGSDGDDTILGAAGNDELQGNFGNDVLAGGNGNDTVYGQAGSDILEGGLGNDVLLGNAGDDIYKFNLGDGQDIVWEEGDTAGDALQLGLNIVASDIFFTNDKGNLILTHNNGTDQVKVSNWFVNTSYQLSKIVFANGTFINNSSIFAPEATVLRGTAIADIFYGELSAAVIFGLDGDDDITGSSFNDILIGGKGYDEIWGGNGEDLYKFGWGDGFDDVYADSLDTLRFLANIKSTDISVERINNNLVLKSLNGTDAVTFMEWYASTASQAKEIVFESDGTVRTAAQLSIMGTNIIHNYTFNLGDGAKIINDWGGIDSLTIGSGISDSAVTLIRSNNNLLLSHINGFDSVTVLDWFNDSAKQIETIKFSQSGNVLSANQITIPLLTLTGTAFNNVLVGGEFYGETILGLEGDDKLYGLGGGDTISGGDGVDFLSGDNGNDILKGDAGFDTIQGGMGDDILIGGTSGDNLSGGSGADTYIYSLGDGYDDILEVGDFSHDIADIILFGSGILPSNIDLDFFGADGLVIYLPDSAQISIDYHFTRRSYAVEYLEFADGNKIGLIDLQINKVSGVYTGSSLDSTIIGWTGTDTLYGGSGNDFLDGFLGSDSLFGGTGNDLYKVDNRNDTVTEQLNEGIDTIYSSITYTLGANIENLTLKDVTSINGTGNNLDNIFIGNSAANIFTGGLGNDTYYLSVGDSAAEATNSGLDIVYTDVTYTMGVNIENGFIIGNNSVNLTGNVLNNIMTGNASANTLNGGAGSDTLSGGLGNDTYVIDVTTDIVIENVNEGSDTVQIAYATTSATTLSAGIGQFNNIENITITGTGLYNLNGDASDNTLIGNASVNTLNGGSGNDTLNGLSGNDTMVGGLGNDTYTIDVLTDVVTESLNEGNDIVYVAVATASGTYTFAANVENATLINTVAFNLTGNALDNLLLGNAAANTLNGGSGNDTLDGLAGIDTMIGGLGDDTYTIDVTTDVITENLNEGIDSVNVAVATASGTYTVAANVENAILTNTAAYNLNGNGLNNLLTGNAFVNVLDGLAGNDTMIGGLGNDTYIIDVTTDVITEYLNEGTDQVNVAVSNAGGMYLLAANIENATLTNTVAYSLTGNILNNVLTGNAAANTLNGGDGNDTLNGLAGNDTMVGGSGSDTYTIDVLTDVITENFDEGVDLVNVTAATASGIYTLAANLENATLTNTVAYGLTGNALENILTGNAAANTLNGGDGNDTLNGLAGNDTMIGGLGNDTYTIDVLTDVITENLNEGIDTINVAIATASGTYTVAAHIENAILTNSVAYKLTGNVLNNYLKGNALVNTLSDTTGGNDIYQGLVGVDTISDTVTIGNNVFDGGTDNDILTGGAGRDLFIGGLGLDTITTGTGYDVISFNKGDGQDIINASTGADNTLSLGGNFSYSDLSLTKATNDLILKMGATDQVTLKEWYASGTTNKSVVNLQVIAEAINGFTLNGSDTLRDNKIENFNFANLVTAFDTAGATANWQLTDARLTAHLQIGSDSAAIGGDLAYQYGKNSNLTGMGLINAQSVIADSNFGIAAQTLNNPSVWQAELVKLS